MLELRVHREFKDHQVLLGLVLGLLDLSVHRASPEQLVLRVQLDHKDLPGVVAVRGMFSFIGTLNLVLLEMSLRLSMELMKLRKKQAFRRLLLLMTRFLNVR